MDRWGLRETMRRQILPIDLEANTVAALDARAGSLSHRVQAMILAAALAEVPFEVSQQRLKGLTFRPTSVTVDPRVVGIVKALSDQRQLRHARRLVIYAAHTPAVVERYLQVMNLSVQLEDTVASLFTKFCPEVVSN